MTFAKNIRGFMNDETGAITVDWVVLVASVIGLAIVVVTLITTETAVLADRVEDELETRELGFPDQTL